VNVTRWRPGLLVVPLLCLLPPPATAGPEAASWAAARKPASGPARAIGGYSAGCLAGAAMLALDGNGYQVMRPSRRRNFGHPALVGFVRDLGKAVRGANLGVLLVGDLGQPRGGPAPSGHSSHQTGLDVDIWYWHPEKALRGRLSRRDRERLSARQVVTAAGDPTRHFSPRVGRMLELAASDARVSRIFVHPGIKRELCRQAGEERGWLRKIRPWWGHNSHFHVRLECPADSPECTPQDPLPEGDGCDQIGWWFDAEAQKDRAEQRQSYRDRVRGTPELPGACAEVRPSR
jgi:penicillin-insensitive murein DD-endopeptidase